MSELHKVDKCPCGVTHPPDQAERTTALVEAAMDATGEYVKNHKNDPQLDMLTIVAALAQGEATKIQQGIALGIIVIMKGAISKLPDMVVGALLDPKVAVDVKTVGDATSGKAGFNVPSLTDLLPKKSGNREDN